MTPVERQTFELWAETPEYQERIEGAKRVIAEALERSKKAYISYSGGKDSLAMLFMALEANKEILVWHWDFGHAYVPRPLEAEVLENARKIGAKNIKVDTSPLYAKAGRSPKNIFFPALFGRVQKEMIDAGYDLAFIGLRAQESVKRRLKTDGHFRWNGKLTECYPLRDLTARDVWAYVVSESLPYCSHYDKYGALLGMEHTRMSTFFDPEFYKFGSNNIDGLLMPEFKHVVGK